MCLDTVSVELLNVLRYPLKEDINFFDIFWFHEKEGLSQWSIPYSSRILILMYYVPDYLHVETKRLWELLNGETHLQDLFLEPLDDTFAWLSPSRRFLILILIISVDIKDFRPLPLLILSFIINKIVCPLSLFGSSFRWWLHNSFRLCFLIFVYLWFEIFICLSFIIFRRCLGLFFYKLYLRSTRNNWLGLRDWLLSIHQRLLLRLHDLLSGPLHHWVIPIGKLVLCRSMRIPHHLLLNSQYLFLRVATS
jgi:hypothetical protein